MRNHDENKDIRLISKFAHVDYANKTIQAPKSTVIGIRSWGRIDYLTNHCGWTFIWNNQVKVSRSYISSTGEGDNHRQSKREAKKAIKDNSLTNKKKRK